jgi:hypothetical protein
MGNLTIDRANPIMNFLTAGCRKIPRSDERPVIAFAANDNYAKAIQTSIMKICKSIKFCIHNFFY